MRTVVFIFFSICLISCSSNNSDRTQIELEKISNEVLENLIVVHSTNEKGDHLEVLFNNLSGTAKIQFNGKNALLQQVVRDSGFYYENPHYKLIGKGANMALLKNDKIVYEHENNIERKTFINNNRDTLKVLLNHTTNEANVLKNTGTIIKLKESQSQTGTYTNSENYIFTIDENIAHLSKENEVIF